MRLAYPLLHIVLIAAMLVAAVAAAGQSATLSVGPLPLPVSGSPAAL